MNDDITTTASAYLDDELSATERAAAEQNPQVMDEVARMRPLVAAMNAIAPTVPSSVIDERIEAALLSARSDRSTQPETPAENTASSTPRSVRLSRVLAVAAGVLGIGVLGAVVLNTYDRDGSLSSSAAPESATTVAATADSMPESMDSDAMADETMSARDESTYAAASAPAATELPAPADGQGSMMSETTAGAFDTAGSAEAVGGAASEPVVASVDELRDITAFFLTNLPIAELPLPPEGTCIPRDPDGRELFVIAAANYEDASSQLSPIWIGVRLRPDTQSPAFTSYAVDQTDCSVIVFAEGSLGG